MDPLAAFLVPLTILLSGAGAVDAPADDPQFGAVLPSVETALVPRPEAVDEITDDRAWVPLPDAAAPEPGQQVRIERNITIRISPRFPRQPDFADLPERMPPRVVERRMGSCVPVRGIAGVQVGRDNKLLLFMRDQRVVSLGLEKSCRARDFYSGFYVERPTDGQICVDRDRLQSRSGANCGLTRLRQLIEE